MNLELLYAAFVWVITAAWLLLIVAPNWRWTNRIVHSIWMPLAIGVWFIALEILKPAAPEGAGMGSIQAVILLIGDPHGVLMSWTTMMGWDLIAGAWFARDARRQKIHHAWVVVCLLVAYMLGIVGLMLYLVIRLGLRREVSLEEVGAQTS